MNAERLLAHYERIADAPDAIARLRRFILDLAVRGKLVPQDANDEPASELLKRAKKNRSHLSLKESRTDKKETTEPEHDLPASWLWARIGDHLELINGAAFKPTDWKPSGIKIVRIQNLNRLDAPFNYCDPKTVRDRFFINDGAFLISCSGTPGTSFGAFIWERGEAVLNQHIFRCDFRLNAFDPLYLRLAINGRLDEMIAKAHGGVGLQHITKGKLEALLIALPPLAEQHRIVAKVDELMGLCDRLQAARAGREAVRDRLTAASLARLNAPDTKATPAKAGTGFASGDASEEESTFQADARFALDALPALTTRPDQIKRLRQTILNLAVRGKLVPQDPNDERAVTFDRAIPDDLERPFEIPRVWNWARLHTLGKLKGGGTPSKARDEFWNGNIPWVSPKDMKIDYIAEAQMSISEEAIAGSAANLIDAGSVLFVVRGMILAHSFPVAISRAPLAINQDMKALVLKRPEMAEYILRALKGVKPEMLKRVQRSSHGTCRLEGSDYSDFLIPVPPLAEQHRIVAKVDALMALCDRLEASLTATAATRRRLLDALLAEALAPVEARELEAVE
jgi:type I restriction enzyme S subunit